MTDIESDIDKVCISGSDDDYLNGMYRFHEFTSNGPSYYSQELDKYLVPMNYDTYYQYQVKSLNYAYNIYCNIYPSNISSYTPNPDDCYNQNGQSWRSVDSSYDTNLRLVNCNDICISGSSITDNNGFYEWLDYNLSTNTSIYYCEECETYLFGYLLNDTYQLVISEDYSLSNPSNFSEQCNLSHIEPPYKFNVDDCIEWEYYDTSTKHWVIDADMTVDKCSEEQLAELTTINDFDIASITFGFTTYAATKSSSKSTITMTLFLNRLQFQCKVQPTSSDTYYSCDISNKTAITECTSNTVKYGIQIDNDNSDALEIDEIVITDGLNHKWEIDIFCFSTSTSQTSNIDSIYKINDNCFHILPIDNTQTYPFIFIAIDDSQVYPMNESSECAVCDDGDTISVFYGRQNGDRLSFINQGKIDKILSWGYRTRKYLNTIWNLMWSPDGNESLPTWDNEEINNCTSFALEEDDYINGYRVIYNDRYVYGLTFYTLSNKSYRCISSSLTLSDYYDSGRIVYDSHYLSGFWMDISYVLHGIAFEFSLLENYTRCSDAYKYILVQEEMTWENATKFCKSTHNSTLATIITDADIQMAVYIRDSNAITTSERLWIGLTDKFNESHWEWVDGTSCDYTSTGLCIDDSHWYPGQPNDWQDAQDYVALDAGHFPFNDLSYYDRSFFLCNNPEWIYEDIVFELITTEFENVTFHTTDPKYYDLSVTAKTSLEISYKYILYTILIVFVLIGFAGFVDAKFMRRNDFFRVIFILTAMLQLSDMMSDIFFAVEVYGQYESETEPRIHFLIIFILSVSCIVIPIFISLYQLNRASSKYWIKENKPRQWLLTYGKLLYFASILSGSSFTAIAIFNSDLFDLNAFDMGLPRKYLLSWNTKKIHSIILCENCPQLILSIWYTFLLGKTTFIPTVQIIFSMVSIITTIMAMILQRKIYFTQDFMDITMDIKGQCIIDNLTIGQQRINGIKKFISESVLGINKSSVDIEKPCNIPNGLQMRIHVSYIHENANINPINMYHELLQDKMEKGKLQKAIANEWKLSSLPIIENIQCLFVPSKQNKLVSDNNDDCDGSDDEEKLPLEDTKIMRQRSIEMMKNIQLKSDINQTH